MNINFLPVLFAVIILSLAVWGGNAMKNMDDKVLSDRAIENTEYGIDPTIRTNCLNGWLTAAGHDLYVRDKNFNPIRCPK